MRSELSNVFTCVEIQKEILFKHGSEYRSKYEYHRLARLTKYVVIVFFSFALYNLAKCK